MSNTSVVYVLSLEPDPVTLRFSVFVDGYMHDWTLDRIKDAVARGAELREQLSTPPETSKPGARRSQEAAV